ncbi:Amidase signature domain [Sesbania bispinosa]|nr:Amidase signature domain [Sesbania bispinosa]
MATKLSRMFLIVLMILLSGLYSRAQRIPLKEATIRDIQRAFRRNLLTSRELVEFYLGEIERLNPLIHGVIEVNPDALYDAIKADYERKTRAPASFLDLHGIPVLLKDNIATKDKTNTTAGSFALLGAVSPREAGVVTKLRNSGAIIFGKASLNEWSSFRSTIAPNGWSARGGFGKNPYVLSADPCGSSSGSGIAAAANLVSVTLATEANGSILCPASYNSVVGIKPTVGLVSQDQVVPITPRQFTVGPITRTVADAVYVLDAIAGFDENDPETAIWSKYIPPRGYKPHLKLNGLRRKRLGIVRNPYFELLNDPYVTRVFEGHFETLRRRGAIVIDNLEIPNISDVLDARKSGERDLILAEYKVYLNQYLEELDVSPVRSLADVIAFNKENSELEMIEEFGQDIMLEAQETNGIGDKEIAIMANLEKLSREGFEKLMEDYNLDAVVTPGSRFYHVLAIGGYPGINVPAGYDNEGIPFGINFGGLKGSEPKLIEIAYAFEQATKIRRPPTFKALKPHVSMPPAERSF